MTDQARNVVQQGWKLYDRAADRVEKAIVSRELARQTGLDRRQVSSLLGSLTKRAERSRASSSSVLPTRVGKTYRRRSRTFTEQQREVVDRYVESGKCPALSERLELSLRMGMTPRQIENYFRNQVKRKKARQLRQAQEKSNSDIVPITELLGSFDIELLMMPRGVPEAVPGETWEGLVEAVPEGTCEGLVEAVPGETWEELIEAVTGETWEGLVEAVPEETWEGLVEAVPGGFAENFYDF